MVERFTTSLENWKEFYYIDTSVLLENIPLVKFIKNILFCHSKIKLISSRHRVIPSMYMMFQNPISRHIFNLNIIVVT